MQDHTVVVDTATTPAGLTFAPVFNVVESFIDRHVAQGRAHKTAILTADETVTYGDLAANVNRAGNVLLSGPATGS